MTHDELQELLGAYALDAVASPATLVVGVAVALAVLALEPQARRPAATGSFSDRTTPGATSSVMASNE